MSAAKQTEFSPLAAAGTALALLGVNAALSIHVWFPADNPALMLIPRVETLIYALLVVAALSRAGNAGTGRRRWQLLAALWLAFGAVYSGAEALFLYIYGRGFAPAADIPMVRGGLLLLFGEIGRLVDILTPLTIILIAALACAISWFWTVMTAWLLRICRFPIPRLRQSRKGGVLASIGFVVLVSGALVVGAGTTPIPVLAARAVGAGDDEFRVLYEPRLTDADGAQEDVAENSEAPTDNDSPEKYVFPGLRDRTIHNIVVESYGYAVFSRPELNDMYRPIHQEFERGLSEAGFQAVSGYLLAPVAGGFSWLAEATFMTGQLINSQPAFLRLIEQDLPSVSSVLRDGGYYTLMVRPGTVHGRWNNEAEFYGFSDTMIPYDGDFAYAGPGFSFVPVTDQFAIWRAHQRIQEATRAGGPAEGKPLYVHYQLVSSHTPFNRIPPYLEDWEELGDGSIYRELEIQTFDNDWGRGNELDEGYIASLDYTMTVVREYLTRFLDEDDNSLILVWGDHQPQRPIREADAHLSVPLHVISRDPTLLEPWLDQGLQPGFVPRQEPPHPHMKTFFPRFLELALPDSERREGAALER